ncbi:peptidase [Sphingobacterium mizutaii NBRC 14946 = DSM 11724]|uniref:Prolyl tripeptidyl peptidase n=2 Tax=Sphingobacterium mizutaii TaxID=1010 RepID=A0AAJ4XA36_9SPHI|nr:S9 family peptidase [Sphingobacterium mizutaii]GEM68547.1 peptidase [Sphingobacterium mizutaii NBRC 14946 = DSM 11724]SDK88801.1 Dipeptidyl aminopeptidase/acylaminoacyl peptidase [Sphingobacterium mizutaii]SNV46695.1 Prolyl tripeptidyl peptidase precursor [Sphingobacterium mizutaii]
MKKLFTLLFVLLSMISTKAQVAGDWKGELEVQGTKMEMIFHISDKDGNLSATMDVPAQGASGLPMSTVKFENNKLNLAMEQAGIAYEGELKGESIEGKFKQGGMEFPLKLAKTKISKPGDPSLVSTEAELAKLIELGNGNYKYKVEDYFAKPKSSSFALSPNGKYISYREKDANNKRHVMVKEVATGKVVRAIEEKDELIRGMGWVNDERLVYIMDQGGNENYHLYAVNIDGTKNIDLTPFEGVQAGILNMLKEQKDIIIIQMNKDNKQVFEPYKVNVQTGEMEKLFTNTDPENAIVGYEFDKDGNLRGYAKMQNGINTQFFYKPNGKTEFELFGTTNWYDTFSILSFNYASKNPDEAYVLTNLDSDKARIVLYDLGKKKLIKEIYSNPDYDATILGLSRNRNWELDYVGYEGEKVEIEPKSETFKGIYSLFKKEFPNYEYSIVGKTDKEDQYLVVVQSDKLYGKYYHLDAGTKKITLLYDLMPQLKEADMSEMRPISFKSRDGLTMHGYITLPKEALEGKKVPLIVNPHGGPQGVRDSWGFNPEAQLFAAHGFATLQVNFRVSGGYGKDFLKAGFKEIGRKAMDDVEDGIKYVIDQGWIDKDNVAIYGGSHGGYAVLRGLTKTPDLYKAGVDYVGVSNIFTLMSSIPEYWKPYKEMLYQVWYDLDDPKEAEIAKEVSPIFHVDKIKAPLFVVQGANDPRVKIAEADQIVKALRDKGVDVPYMVKYDEGHGFGKEENQIEFYKAMMGFFHKHLN